MNDPSIKVCTSTGARFDANWNISMPLTDRWGEVLPREPGDMLQAALQVLEADTHLLERLRLQMWDELTFLARKDGEFGVVFEVEYESIESDNVDDDPSRRHALAPYVDVVDRLIRQSEVLGEQFPQLQFCVPEAGMVYRDRPAIWAFAKDGALDDEQREALGTKLLDFAYPSPVVADTESEDETSMGARP